MKGRFMLLLVLMILTTFLLTSYAKELTDSGPFTKKVEPNLIEVKLSGAPDKHSARLFPLSKRSISGSESLNFQAVEIVLFQYAPVDESSDVIIEIKHPDN